MKRTVKLVRTRFPLTLGLMETPVTVSVPASVRDSFQKIAKDLKVYDAAKLGQVFEAVYRLGIQTGAAQVISQVEETTRRALKLLPRR